MIDWNRVWKDTLLASRDGRLENCYVKEEAADRYDRSEVAWLDGERRAAALKIDPSWSVLDIGAGPESWPCPGPEGGEGHGGEPSPAMVERLKRHIGAEGFPTSGSFPPDGEDLAEEEVGQHDLAIASYSLAFWISRRLSSR